MSLTYIDEAINSIENVPKECQEQLEFQRREYNMLLKQAQSYNWMDLFTKGVTLKDIHLDEDKKNVPSFLSKVVSPVVVTLFRPDSSIVVKSVESPLEHILASYSMYTGPICRKVSYSTKEGSSQELVNSIKIAWDGTKNLVRFTC